jgi:general secretion pathway protein H
MNRSGWPDLDLVPRSRGFTLIEMMVVLAIVALLTGVVSWSMRDSAAVQLKQEGERLALWLESARVQARVQGLAVTAQMSPHGVVLQGLPADTPGSTQGAIVLSWLHPGTQPVGGDALLLLGPEPFIPSQQVQLGNARDPSARTTVWTSGAGPWRAAP